MTKYLNKFIEPIVRSEFNEVDLVLLDLIIIRIIGKINKMPFPLSYYYKLITFLFFFLNPNFKIFKKLKIRILEISLIKDSTNGIRTLIRAEYYSIGNNGL
jgi:hypothetical protein